MRDQFISHAIREVRLVLVGGKILEWQNDERGDLIGGCSNNGRLAQIADSEATSEDNPEQEYRGQHNYLPREVANHLAGCRRKSWRKRGERWVIFRKGALRCAYLPSFRLGRVGYGGGFFLDRGNKAVATTRKRLDEARVFGGIVQSFTEPHDCRVEAVIKVDEGVAGPEAALQFFASDHFPAVFQKDGEDLTGLFLELDANAVLAEFAGPEVKLVNAEAHRVCRYGGLFHGVVCGREGEYNPACRGRQRGGRVTRASKWFILLKTMCDK